MTSRLAIFIFALVSLTLPVNAQDLPQQIRARYDAGQALQTRFVQVISSDFLETDERFTGELWLLGPKYRIETGGQTIVSDGTTSWILNRAENQVIINAVDPDDDAFSLTAFLREFDTAYAVEVQSDARLDGQPVHILELTPSDPFASFQRVTMSVQPNTLDIVRLVVVDLNDVTMEFRMSGTNRVPPADVPATIFTFRIPDGVDAIDLR